MKADLLVKELKALAGYMVFLCNYIQNGSTRVPIRFCVYLSGVKLQVDIVHRVPDAYAQWNLEM